MDSNFFLSLLWNKLDLWGLCLMSSYDGMLLLLLWIWWCLYKRVLWLISFARLIFSPSGKSQRLPILFLCFHAINYLLHSFFKFWIFVRWCLIWNWSSYVHKLFIAVIVRDGRQCRLGPVNFTMIGQVAIEVVIAGPSVAYLALEPLVFH